MTSNVARATSEELAEVNKYKYVFKIGDNPAGPVRDSWEAAFQDAEAAGYAKQLDAAEYRTDHEKGVRIVRVK